MIKRGYRTQESQIRYWVDQAVSLCRDIEDESLAETIPPVEDAKAALLKDRRVLVFGGKGCGKSALLAGICGCPAIARVQTGTPCVRWRYVCTDGDAEDSRFLAEESLAGLEMVDTQDCADEAAADAVRRLIPGADVLIAVVDTRSAQSSPVWGILAELPKEALETCLLAATFSDKVSAEATLNIAKNLQEFSKERLGSTPRICVCNPTSEQSIASLSVKVQEILNGEHGVRADIRSLSEKGMDVLRRQGRVLNARAAVARTDSSFLSNIEQEIDNFLTRQEQGVPGLIDNYAGVALHVMPQLQRRLRHVLGYTFSPITMLRLKHLAAGTEDCLYDMICQEILGMQHDADRQFIISCAGHWKSVRPRMEKTLACEIGEFPELELDCELATLRTGLCRDLHEPFIRLKLRYELSRVFTAPTGWMMTCLWVICLFLIAAGVLGFIGLDDEALLCVGLSFLAWLLSSAAHYLCSRKLLAHVATHTGILSDGLREALTETAGNFVVSRVAAYRFLYVKPRQTVAQHEAMLAPLQERYKDINRQLSATAQRL